MKIKRMSKRVLSAILALALVLTACFQYGIGSKAADAGTPVETDVSAIWSGQNGQVITFQLANSDWDSHGAQNVVPGGTYNTYNFYDQVQIYYNDGTGEKSVSLRNAHYDQIYFSMWGNTNALSIQINSAYYPYATKIVIPAGTIFPSFAYTGGTPLGGTAIAATSSDMNGYIVTAEIVFEGTANASSQTYWERKKATAVETVMLDLPSSTVRRLAFNIAGDDDNGALANWCYIVNSKHDEYNTKDYVEIYLKGESTPKTLKDYFKTDDGNMYWNLYEAGSMTFPLLDDFPDATAVEKIVIKKGCEFPSVAYTGANDPVGGGVFSETTKSKTSYVVNEDVTFVINDDATATNASFTFVDTSTTTETAVTGIKTGHNSDVATFTLSATDYAGCSTNRPSGKYADYNFMDKIQIVSGDTVQKLSDVYPSGDQIYYNMWDLQDSFTISLGSAYDTVTKIIIPAGTVFPSAAYTGYGAFDATNIPDNMARNKGGFKTTEDIVFEKPDGTGELVWTVVEEEIEVTQVTKIENIHVRGGGSDFRLMLFLSNNDYTAQADATFSKVAEYNTLDNILLYDIDGNEIKLNDIDTEKVYYKCWTDENSIGFGINAHTALIAKVVIKAGCELPTYSYTNGTAAERTMYVVENETVFSLNTTPSDNTGNTNWYRDEILPVETVETEITKIHVRTGTTEGTRFLLFSSANDYGTTEFNIGADVTKFAKYNTLDYIVLETTNGEIYTLSEIYDAVPAYNLWGETNCFSMKLTDGLNPICKVTVKAGCELPSRAFTEGRADTQLTYVVKNDTIFTINNPTNNTSNTNWAREEILPLEEVQTTISNIHVRTGGETRLMFFLGTNDYGTTDPNYAISTSVIEKYNILNKVKLYTTTGEEYTLSDVYGDGALFNSWGDYGTFAVYLDSGLNPINKVVIEAGAQFPSMAYAKGTADSQLTYVLSEDITFVHSTTPTNNTFNTNWQKAIILPEVRETTKISNVHVRGGGTDYRLMLFLSNHDYEQQLDINFSKLKEYNMLDYISLYDANDNEIVLNTVDEERAYYKSWGDDDSIGIGIDETIAVITKVKIKAGCELPSQDYTNGSPSQKTIYVVENDTTFTLSSVPSDNSGSVHWNRDEVLLVEEVATDVDKIHVRTGTVGVAEHTELLLFLSNHDYGSEGNVSISASVLSKYNTLKNIVLKTTAGEELTLADVYDNAAYFNLWGEVGSVALQLQSGLNPICEVTIKAGCELPSKAYADGTSDTQLTYVIPEDITFTFNGTPADNITNTSWTKEEAYPVETKNTDINNIHVRTGTDTELLLFLSNHDYGTTSETMNVGRLVKYNTLDNILLYTNTGSVYTLRQLYDNAAFYNIWNEAGSVAIQFDGSVGVISKVFVKAGCELPSKEYTNGDNPTRKLTYVVESDTIFTVKQIPDSNKTTVHWDKTNPRTIETDIKKVVFANNILGVYLDESDYGSSKTLMSDKHANYNYLNQIRVYTSDTEYVTLATALGEGEAWLNANNLLEFTLNVTPIRIVIPAYAVFPTKAYVDGTKQEMSGYEIPNEKIFELIDGTWENVSVGVSRLYGDANGDDEISSLDLVRMKKYFKDGYGMNNFGNCDDEASVNENDIVLLRKSMVGSYTLHPYVKKSSSLTYFMSQDGNMDYFLNDYFKRHAGYVDYVEGEMTATSYRPGESFEGMFNTQWMMEASTWYSSSGFDIDTTERLREWLDKVPVDKYGYVWNGNDDVEDSKTDLANGKHAMGWPLPNANDANADTSDLSVYWDFNDGFKTSNNRELGCVWDSNIGAKGSNGLYAGTASGKSEVYFEVKDYAVLDSLRTSIVQTEYAPWLAIDLRMTMDDISAIDDIYVWYTTSRDESYSTTKRISVKETAPIWYDMTGTSYEHMLYVPMYTQDGWYSGNGASAKTGASDIYKIKIQIVPTAEAKTLSGTFALNYVRPSFDTRYSNNNALYISTLKEYYSMTGDIAFVQEYITNARKAMNFLMQMYDTEKHLNKQSYLFGHYGSTTELYDGLTNGYWDVTYTPIYDFQSNMYFYEALRDLAYLEDALTKAGITVSDSATISTATIDGLGSSEYTYAGQLDTVKADVLAAMQTTFWNGTRFVAGKDNSGNVADNGHVVWNLQAIESGIATEEQAAAIMSWIDGESNMYQYGLAPMTNTIDNIDSGMYSSFYPHTNMVDNGIGEFGQNVQNGGAVMYSSYYDLMSRLQVNDTEDAYDRLTAIRDWYLPIAEAYDYKTEEATDFYYNYFNEQGKVYYYLQNGSRDVDGDGAHDCGNGIIGLDGEFPESLLAVAAVPRGFFGMESINANCVGFTPSLPSELQHWKIENMEFHNVKYDASLFDGIVRIDSVEGNTEGLTIQIALDYTEGQKVYINEVETKDYIVENGKAIVTVDFKEVIVEVR